MTQAFNLSQLANKVNSSGQLDATTGLSGATPIANGGTNNASLAVTAGGVVYTDGSKLVNVGAGSSGQFLQSNGSSPPSWSDVGSTNYNGIGTYAIAFGDATTAYTTNSTIAGASLVYCSTGSYGGFSFIRATTNAAGTNVQVLVGGSDTFTTLGLSGTWRCMTKGGLTPASGIRQLHLWVRIS